VKHAWIYDTPALTSYATETSRRVNTGLTYIIYDPEFRLIIPTICLVEAYAALPAEHRWRLDSLALNPGVTVVGVSANDAMRLGALAAVTGRAGAAHAAFLANDRPAIVFTDDTPMPAGTAVRPI
jgi:hypothetical protein